MKIEESAVHYCVGLYPKRMIVSSYLGKRAKCRISILGGGGEIKNCRYILFLSSTFHWRDGVVFFISVTQFYANMATIWLKGYLIIESLFPLCYCCLSHHPMRGVKGTAASISMKKSSPLKF